MSKQTAKAHGQRKHQALSRTFTALVAGVLTAAIISPRMGIALRLVAGWDGVALVMSGLAWWTIFRSTPQETRRRAAGEDPGRTTVWVLILMASTLSLFATTVVVRQARTLAPEARDVFVALCIVAVISSWVLTHTGYTLRYAHLYYRDDAEGEGGLLFPSATTPAPPPAYIDFAYFAFTVGMCFQVSDVTVCSRQIRRAVMVHALLSFAYNTVILAVAVNLVVGIFG
ncbi:MAG TPA: DUF1345 domain-containing protein [Polyangia bacterium]|jgi:uncharacterized membrane protein|nr:DUF1345 domain-containing protein [Polyangia bacterium]